VITPLFLRHKSPHNCTTNLNKPWQEGKANEAEDAVLVNDLPPNQQRKLSSGMVSNFCSSREPPLQYFEPITSPICICNCTARLAAFDEARAQRRADADEDGDEDGSVDSAQKEIEREAMEVGRRMADIMTTDDAEDGEYVEKEYKPKGVEGLIEVDNPNKAPVKMMKMKDMGNAEPVQLTRKEREEKEREAKAAAYRKRHEAGLTDEYKRDMAKLAEVKARREAAQAKAAAEKEAEKAGKFQNVYC
jgi:hypothetical protein